MMATRRRVSVGSGALAAVAIAGIITAASAQPPKATAPKPTATPTATKPAATAKPTASATATKPATTATGTTAAPTATAPVAVKAKPTALGNQVRAAAAGFQPIAAGAVAQSKAELQQAVAVLDAYLRSLGAWEAQWKDYLFWNQLTAELAKPNNYDVAALMRVQRRYSGGFVGLEEPEFRAVGDALVKFAHLADAAQNAKLADEYKTRLNALADAVDAVGDAKPTAAQSAVVAENAAWLDARGQAPQVVELIGTKYSQPNLLIDVSETFVVDALSRPVDQTEPVVDCILGTYITGTGRTIGEVNVDVVPNGEQAELVTYLSGINYSRTVGHNRSALIYSQGATTLNGQ
jgi:hypothetical protein